MTLPTSGSLAISAMRTEFSTSAGSLSQYYAGGGVVPSGTSGTNGAVPTSGTLSISKFYGTSNILITLVNTSVGETVTTPNGAYALYQVNSNGTVYTGTRSGGTGAFNDWINLKSYISNYEVTCSINDGDTPSGPLNTWSALSTTRTWQLSANRTQDLTTSLTVQIRKIGTTNVLASCTVNLHAEGDLA